MLLQGHYIASFPGPPENEANQLQATKISSYCHQFSNSLKINIKICNGNVK